jgi:lipopolysaccharide/colanic/teichoic acid biosynthesis glycosyltransferase
LTHDGCDPDSGLYREDYFQELLCRERKRTERSGKPFMLLGIALGKIPDHRERRDAAHQIASVLFASTRETDVKGWYQTDTIVGVLFCEPPGIVTSGRQAMEGLVLAALKTVLNPEQLQAIEIFSQLFPESSEDKHGSGPPGNALYPDLSERHVAHRHKRKMKRVLDILGSVLGLVLFSPLFVMIPLLIKWTSRGPVFFSQERIGEHGKVFTFLKFRTMYADSSPELHRKYVSNLIAGGAADGRAGAGDNPQPLYKMQDDPRITPLGRILRKTSLDELPQFFNVLKGDMSLVGPRPPIAYEVEEYDLWHRRRFLETKPGITGLWQVKGRSTTTFDDMVRLDLRYAREWSILLDLEILARTPWAVLKGKGAH